MRLTHRLMSTAFCALALLPSAWAAEINDWLTLEGFGTAGMFWADDPVASVRTDARQSSGSRRELRFDGDSQLSLQATASPTEQIKGVLQLLAKKDLHGSQRPKVEWAYVGWDATPALHLKFGRSVAPVFLMSDYRNLLYAQTAARPPLASYGTNAASYIDGVTLLLNKPQASGRWEFEGFAGVSTVTIPNGKVSFDRAWGLSAKWLQGPWAVRAGYSYYDFQFDAPSISANVAQLTTLPASLCDNCASVVPNRAKLKELHGHIATLGLSYDDGHWIGQAEYIFRSTNTTAIPDLNSSYLLLGRRIGDFTPYFGVDQLTVTSTPIGLRPGPQATAAFQAQLHYLNESYLGLGRGDRRGTTLGTRWDFAKNLALKAQWEHMRSTYPLVGNNATVAYPTSLLGKASGYDGAVNLYTLNLDFVF